MKNLLPPLMLIICTLGAFGQTTYTWTGLVSSSWTYTKNWSSYGDPGSSDYIIIQTGTNDLKLTSDKTVDRYKINSGIMDLNGFTLTVNDKLEILGGTTTSGEIVQNATNIANINNATVQCKLDLIATKVEIQHSDLTDSVKVKQTTTTSGSVFRGNRFYGHLDVENAANANFNMGWNPPDSSFAGLTMRGKRLRAGCLSWELCAR